MVGPEVGAVEALAPVPVEVERVRLGPALAREGEQRRALPGRQVRPVDDDTASRGQGPRRGREDGGIGAPAGRVREDADPAAGFPSGAAARGCCCCCLVFFFFDAVVVGVVVVVVVVGGGGAKLLRRGRGVSDEVFRELGLS